MPSVAESPVSVGDFLDSPEPGQAGKKSGNPKTVKNPQNSPAVLRKLFEKSPGKNNGQKEDKNGAKKTGKTSSNEACSSERLKSWKSRLQRKLKSSDKSHGVEMDPDGSFPDQELGMFWKSPLHQTLSRSFHGTTALGNVAPDRSGKNSKPDWPDAPQISVDDSPRSTNADSDWATDASSTPRAVPVAPPRSGRPEKTCNPSVDAQNHPQRPELENGGYMKRSNSSESVQTATYAELKQLARLMRAEHEVNSVPLYEDLAHFAHQGQHLAAREVHLHLHTSRSST